MKNLIQIEKRKRTILILMDNMKQAIRFINVADAVADMKKELIRLEGELNALEWVLMDTQEQEENLEELDRDFSYF